MLDPNQSDDRTPDVLTPEQRGTLEQLMADLHIPPTDPHYHEVIANCVARIQYLPMADAFVDAFYWFLAHDGVTGDSFSAEQQDALPAFNFARNGMAWGYRDYTDGRVAGDNYGYQYFRVF